MKMNILKEKCIILYQFLSEEGSAIPGQCASAIRPQNLIKTSGPKKKRPKQKAIRRLTKNTEAAA